MVILNTKELVKLMVLIFEQIIYTANGIIMFLPRSKYTYFLMLMS